MEIQNNKLILEGSELISLGIMLEDLPAYLSVSGVQLSAISELQRKEILQKINIISKMIKGDVIKCQKCNNPSETLHGDYGELLCPKCYKEVTKGEKK